MGDIGSALGSVTGGVGDLVGGTLNPLSQGIFGSAYSPTGAPLLQPTDKGQLDQAYHNVNQGLDQQMAFLQALQGQNGVQNQSNVYGQLAGIANGQGPNPAQAALNQATANNIASQASLMAGQRGAGANIGLLARQAAMQGGNINQQAAGQGATMQAQQQLAAINAMGNIANQQVSNQGNATSAYNQAAQNAQGNLLNAAGNYNNSLTSQQQSINQIREKENQYNKGLIGGAIGAAGSLMQGSGGGAAMAHGGMVENKYASGGGVSLTGGVDLMQGDTFLKNTPQSFVGQYLTGGMKTSPMAQAGTAISDSVDSDGAKVGKATGSGLMKAGKTIAALFNKGGEVPAKVSPGERYLDPKDVKKVAEGKEDASKAGEKIPGKAKVKGDNLKNDTVSKKLEAGGIVIPRSILQSEDPHKAAADFVAAVLAKKGLR